MSQINVLLSDMEICLSKLRGEMHLFEQDKYLQSKIEEMRECCDNRVNQLETENRELRERLVLLESEKDDLRYRLAYYNQEDSTIILQLQEYNIDYQIAGEQNRHDVRADLFKRVEQIISNYGEGYRKYVALK